MRTVRFDIAPHAVLLVLGVALGVWLFAQVWPIVLSLVCALMIVGAVNPVVAFIEAKGVRRSIAAIGVFLTIFASLLGFAILCLSRLVPSGADLFAHFPEKQAQVAERLDHVAALKPLATKLRESNPADWLARGVNAILDYGPHAVEIVAYGASALFLALYLTLDRDRVRGLVYSLVPRRHHVRTSRVFLGLERIVGGYVRGQLITSALMAIFAFIVLTAMGVKGALLLALFAGIADVLPYIGAFLVCVPATIATFSERGSVPALVVLIILAVYQEFESRVIVPRVYGRVLRLPASMILLALLVGGKLMGIVGALLALPVAAALRMIVRELRIELPGEEGGDVRTEVRDAIVEDAFAKRARGLSAADASCIALELAERTESTAGVGLAGQTRSSHH